MTLNDLKPLMPPDAAIFDLAVFDVIGWILLPVLAAVLIVWVWRLLKAAAGVLSWVLLLGLLIFTASRLIGLIP